MRYWGLIAIPAAWLVQAAVVGRAGPLAAVPDIPLLVAVFTGMTEGSDTGAAAGFCVGMLGDLSRSRYIGLHALSKAVAGYVAGIAGRRVFPDRLAVPFLCGLAASLANDVLLFVVLKIAGSGVTITSRISSILLAALYNGCLAPLVFLALFALEAKKPVIQGKM